MPLTPRQFRENLERRVAATYEEDERLAAELRTRLPEAVRLIVAALGERRIVLFGSLATGLFFAAHSDVDLAVEGVGIEAPDALADELKRMFGRKVDLIDPEISSEAVRRAIATQGIVLHEPGREDR